VINGEAQVMMPDVLVTNGIVHVIDKVLEPPGVEFDQSTSQVMLIASDDTVFGSVANRLLTVLLTFSWAVM